MAARTSLISQLSFALLLLAGQAWAEDQIVLSDGRELAGSIVSEDAAEVHLAQGTAVQVIARSRIKEIRRAPVATQPAPVATPVAPGATSAAPTAGTVPAVEVATTPTTYPALRRGSVLVIRTGESLDAERDRRGRRFAATLAENASIDGVVVLPAGTPVEAELHETERGGRLFGRSVLEITVVAILLGERRLPCSTDAAVVRGSSATPDTVGKVATGTVIGAIVDGEHGAGVGAAIGAGVALLTPADSVHLPVGTILDVRITAPFDRNAP
jgi:hypothetical protein